MRRHFFTALFLFASLSLVMAAGTQEKEPVQNDGPVTISVLTTVLTQNPEGPLAQEYIDSFLSENPDIKVEIISVPMNQALTKITTLAAAGELPDVFVNTESLSGKLYDMGICDDMSPFLTSAEKANFSKAILDSCTIDGKIIAYPWYTVPNALLYRADWLKEKGITPPATWDEFLKASVAMTGDSDNDGQVDHWGFGMVGTADGSGMGRFVQVLRTFGASELYEENGTWKTDVGTPESIAAFKMFAELKTKYNVVPPGSLENSFNENVNLFAAGKTGMMISGPHTTGKVLSINPELKGKLGSVAIPKGENQFTPLSYLGFSLSTESKHKEEAMAFVKYLTTKDRMIKWVETTGRMPCIEDALATDYLKDPMFSGFLEGIANQQMIPTVAFYDEARNVLGKTYQKLMLDPSLDVAAEVKAAGKEIQNIIDRQ